MGDQRPISPRSAAEPVALALQVGIKPVAARALPYSFLAPAATVVGGLLAYPLLLTVYWGLTRFNGVASPRFVGLANYGQLLRDPILFRSFDNTLMWVVGTLLLPVGLGLVVAILSFGLKGGSLYRFVFLLPYGFSGTAVGIVWSFTLRSDGAANGLLRALHLGALTHHWLLDTPLNTLAMVLAATWHVMGISATLFLVGLQNMPRQPIEAATLDGASGWSLFRFVTWPLLRPMATVVVGLALTSSLKTFDIIWVMTQGGPGRSSETLAVTMYRSAFLLFQYGYGSAIAVVLSVIIVLASWFYIRRQVGGFGGDALP